MQSNIEFLAYRFKSLVHEMLSSNVLNYILNREKCFKFFKENVLKLTCMLSHCLKVIIRAPL